MKSNHSTEQEQETSNQNDSPPCEESLDIPPPPPGIYKDLKTVTDTIKEFAQPHGYAIVFKRTISGKSAHYKCDRSAIFCHVFHS
jgi:hypothetical protein